MRGEYDRFWFQSPKGAGAVGQISQLISRFSDMPVGAELEERLFIERWNPGRLGDQIRLVDNPSSPGETAAGRDWQHTQFNASTVTIVDTGFPPFMRIATGATISDGQQLQACKGLADATGAPTTSTRTLYSTANSDLLYMSVTCRMLDANNDAATLLKPFWFFGFAPVDTTLTAGAFDHVGIGKFFDTDVVQLGSNRSASSMPWADTAKVDLFHMGSPGFNLANKWFTVSFIVLNLDRTNQKGVAYAFLDTHRTPLGAEVYAPTHVGTLNLAIANSVPTADMCPSIAFRTAEAVAKTLDIAQIITATRYKLNT